MIVSLVGKDACIYMLGVCKVFELIAQNGLINKYSMIKCQ